MNFAGWTVEEYNAYMKGYKAGVRTILIVLLIFAAVVAGILAYVI